MYPRGQHHPGDYINTGAVGARDNSGLPLMAVPHSLMNVSGPVSGTPIPMGHYPVDPYSSFLDPRGSAAADFATRRAILAQADEVQRQHHLLRSYLNRTGDEKMRSPETALEGDMLFRDAAYSAALGGNGAHLNHQNWMMGTGAGMFGAPIPRMLASMGGINPDNQGQLHSRLSDGMGQNTLRNETDQNEVRVNGRKKRSRSDSAESSDKEQDEKDSISSSSKKSSKKSKLLTRQQKQNEAEIFMSASESSAIQMKNEPKARSPLVMESEKFPQPHLPAVNEEPEEPFLPSYQKIWRDLEMKVAMKAGHLNEEYRLKLLRSLFSDALHANSVVILPEGEGWSKGFNISGRRSGNHKGVKRDHVGFWTKEETRPLVKNEE